MDVKRMGLSPECAANEAILVHTTSHRTKRDHMPTLPNARHERFAQQLASGKSATEAYAAAGFRPSRHNGAALAHSQHISERVSELLAEREKVHGQATAAAIERVALTKTWVLDRLIENVDRAMQHQAIMGADGMETGEYRYDGAVANRALELLGKELGMFISRSEVRRSPLDELDPDDIRQLRAAVLREKARRLAGGDGQDGGGKPN